jgi:hypothetical protein
VLVADAARDEAAVRAEADAAVRAEHERRAAEARNAAEIAGQTCVVCGAPLTTRLVWNGANYSPFVCLVDRAHLQPIPPPRRRQRDTRPLPVLGTITVSGEFIPSVRGETQ